jgi:tryptophan 7-halogenase
LFGFWGYDHTRIQTQLGLSGMTQSHIKRVVIVGGGTAGWMSAALLSKALGGKVAVELVESEEIGTVGVGEATIPMIKLFNKYLEIDAADFVAKTNGSMKLGIEFVNWGRQGDRYLHTFGTIGHSHDLIDFHHYWLRARDIGMDVSLWDYSLHYRAAVANKFDQVEGENGAAGLPYAFHFDAALYARYLRNYAEARGVVRTEGKIVEVLQHPETGYLTGVKLDNGKTAEGEFFIDCSGFRGLLIEQTLKAGYHDWSHLLRCDRALAVPCESVAPITPYTRSTARKAGWQWRIPLQSRIGNGLVYSSQYMSDDEAATTLMSNLDGKALADPRPIKFVTGKRKKTWDKNVLALGLASGFMEPLESTSIHLVQSGLSRFIEMFPTADFAQHEIDQYNQDTLQEWLLIRDFLVLHYHLNQRTDSPFWRDVREMKVPETLTQKMALFAGTGRICHDKRDLFADPSWIQVMVGQNLMPKGYHPMAANLSNDELRRFLLDIKSAVTHVASRMPLHDKFLSQNCPAELGPVSKPTPKLEMAG